MTRSSSFQLRFLHPRYAMTWLVFLLARVGSWLPRKATMALGRWLGNQFYRRNRKRRGIAMANLKLCFPQLSEAERIAMCRRHFQIYGMTIVDLGLVWWGSDRKLSRLVEIEGMKPVQEIVDSGRQIIFFSPHACGIDVGGIVLSSRVYLSSMMKRSPDPFLNWLLLYGRHRFGGVMVMRDEGIKALIRLMRKGRNCYLIPDEDLGLESGHFVPFFGVQRATLSVVGRLAALTKAVVVPMYTRLDDVTGKYHIRLGEALKEFPSRNVYEDTRRVSEMLEQSIRIGPEQYMWTLRWFKTRPEGEQSPYKEFE